MAEPELLEGAGAIPFDPEMYRDEMLEKLERQAEHYTGVRIDRQLHQGKTVAEIVRAAPESRCDLIVLGSHGWSPLRRFLLGSVAEGVTRKAPCAVLSLRAPLGHEMPMAEAAEVVAR